MNPARVQDHPDLRPCARALREELGRTRASLRAAHLHTGTHSLGNVVVAVADVDEVPLSTNALLALWKVQLCLQEEMPYAAWQPERLPDWVLQQYELDRQQWLEPVRNDLADNARYWAERTQALLAATAPGDTPTRALRHVRTRFWPAPAGIDASEHDRLARSLVREVLARLETAPAHQSVVAVLGDRDIEVGLLLRDEQKWWFASWFA